LVRSLLRLLHGAALTVVGSNAMCQPGYSAGCPTCTTWSRVRRGPNSGQPCQRGSSKRGHDWRSWAQIRQRSEAFISEWAATQRRRGGDGVSEQSRIRRFRNGLLPDWLGPGLDRRGAWAELAL